ncbi:MAG: hypothetical protein ACP5E5_04180 [Acidobacteriaceae bacterium]
MAAVRGEGGFILRIVILLGVFAAVQIGSGDPRVGNWTLDSARVTLTPPNQLSITRTGDREHVLISGETHVAFSAKTNGQATAVEGNPLFDQIEMHRIDRKHVVMTEKKEGEVVATVDDRLSKDGKELTVTSSGQGAGGLSGGERGSRITVWTRGGGEKRVGDPFAGLWIQDMGRTLMRQGLALKIEPDGRGGVRFSWSFSYDARLDGRQYDLQNSRNDTVQLTLVNGRTVDAVYRRDGQVTEKAEWIVSADRREMTMTDAGTLQTGQHITETLVFHRQ